MEFDSSIDKFSFYWFILFVLQIGAAAGLFPTPMLLDVYLMNECLRFSCTKTIFYKNCENQSCKSWTRT